MRWLLRTPRHQAEATSRPAPGKRMRTRRMVSSRFSPWKPGAIASISQGAAQDTEQNEQRGAQGEQSRDGAGGLARLLLVLAGEQVRVDGNEGSGQHPFAEQVLQDVGDAERGLEHVGGVGVAEVVREHPVTDESGDAAEEDPCSNEDGKALGACRGRGGIGRGHEMFQTRRSGQLGMPASIATALGAQRANSISRTSLATRSGAAVALAHLVDGDSRRQLAQHEAVARRRRSRRGRSPRSRRSAPR